MATTNHSLRLVAGLVVAMFALAGCVGVFFAPPKVAQATFPGQNGNIAYEVSDEFDSDIYTINATGGTPFNVTDNNTTLDEGPSYSPDGQKIAYQGYDGIGNYDIFTIDASGGTPFNVTDNNTTSEFEPSYSPDGQKIAYSGYNGTDGTGQQIYTIDASGGEPFNVTNNTRSETDPSWGIADKDAEPTTKEECKNGGYEQFGFKNQGECIRAVEGKKIGAPKATAPGAAGTATTAPDAAVPLR